MRAFNILVDYTRWSAVSVHVDVALGFFGSGCRQTCISEEIQEDLNTIPHDGYTKSWHTLATTVVQVWSCACSSADGVSAEDAAPLSPTPKEVQGPTFASYRDGGQPSEQHHTAGIVVCSVQRVALFSHKDHFGCRLVPLTKFSFPTPWVTALRKARLSIRNIQYLQEYWNKLYDKLVSFQK